MVTRFHRSRR